MASYTFDHLLADLKRNTYTQKTEEQLQQEAANRYSSVYAQKDLAAKQAHDTSALALDRQIQAMGNVYGKQREASQTAYNQAYSQANRQATSRGMQRSSFNNANLGSIAIAGNKAQQEISDQESTTRLGLEDQKTLLARQLSEQQRLHADSKITDTNAYLDELNNREYERGQNAMDKSNALSQQLYQYGYQQSRDQAADEQWAKQFNENIRQYDTSHTEGQRQFNENLAESRRQYDTNFGENKRQFDLGFSENQRQYDTTLAENQRQYDTSLGENRRQYDTTFAENQRQHNDTMAYNRESLAENRRQYDTTFAENQRQFEVQQTENVRQFNSTLTEQQRQFDLSTAEGKRQFEASLTHQQAQLLEEIRQFDAQLQENQRQFDRLHPQKKKEVTSPPPPDYGAVDWSKLRSDYPNIKEDVAKAMEADKAYKQKQAKEKAQAELARKNAPHYTAY